MLDRFKEQAASWSRRVLFVDVIFAVSISANNPPPFFLKALGGRAGGRVRASSCDAGGGSAAPPPPLSGSPPLFFSRARACNVLAFFFAGNLLDAVRRWRSFAVRKKNERRVCLLVGCSLFQRKLQYKKNLKFKCTKGASAAAAVLAAAAVFVLVARVVVVVVERRFSLCFAWKSDQ